MATSPLADQILKWMTEGEFVRGVRLQGTVAGFDKWLDFMEFQHIKCASMTPSETVYYWNFVDEVVGKAQMMDKEHMIPMILSGFCFSLDGELLLFNER